MGWSHVMNQSECHHANPQRVWYRSFLKNHVLPKWEGTLIRDVQPRPVDYCSGASSAAWGGVIGSGRG